jgi:dTDP-4-amino-4,6-dideoxygalactose transaminase
MEQERINILKQYLQNLKLPEGITSKEKKYLEKEAHNFTIYRDNLHRYNTENGIIRKVLNKEQAEEIMYTYHQHPLGGHLAYNNTLHKIASRYYWDSMNKDIMEYSEGQNCPNVLQFCTFAYVTRSFLLRLK